MKRSVNILLATLAFAVPAALEGQAGSPAGAVPVAQLTARRQALIGKLKSGVALIRGASELSDDPPDSQYPQASSFRQDNDFFYFTGLETHDSWLLVVATDSLHGEAHLFLPPRNPQQERWTGPTVGPGPEAAAATGIPAGNIHSADSVEPIVRRLLGQGGRTGGSTLWVRHTERDTRPEFVSRAVLGGRNLTSRDLLPVLA
ncbi:MAG TPA: aminopeptidase P N-terminal domain-containing protein, partial [Gemmatimonadales bacterium]|nr:aminopeptidase P N-terminal domain-containing protein [Gemmatimonadales bacterium]